MIQNKLLCGKHLEFLFIAFRGLNIETSSYIGFGAVSAMSDRVGEPVGQPVGWNSKACALSINHFV